LSKFAIDVDTPSYTISRRKILEAALPSYQCVCVEEVLTYSDCGYQSPSSGPFTVHLAAAPSPFTKGSHSGSVAVQGKRIDAKERLPVPLVYRVDTRACMQSTDTSGLA